MSQLILDVDKFGPLHLIYNLDSCENFFSSAVFILFNQSHHVHHAPVNIYSKNQYFLIDLKKKIGASFLNNIPIEKRKLNALLYF